MPQAPRLLLRLAPALLLPFILVPPALIAQGAPEMVLAEGGSFSMGARDGNSYVAEEGIHRVELSGFFIAAREVRLAEFREFAGRTGYLTDAERGAGAWILSGGSFRLSSGASWRDPGFVQSENDPALCVSWNDAVEYCLYLSAVQGLPPAYARTDAGYLLLPESTGYRLPTEAEWEYAARGGKKAAHSPYPGSGPIESLGWYLDDSGGRSHPVGALKPNALGLYDMCGNAWEWCQDYFSADYYLESPVQDPPGPASGLTRCARGGSWANRYRNCRLSQRYARPPGESYSYMGFRLARSVSRPAVAAP
jgi:formylglycine-generating enzyme required for sulfatase activity